MWERPEDLLGRADVDKAISTTPEQLLTTIPKGEKPQVEIVMDSTENTADIPTNTAASTRRRTDSESSADDADTTPTKKQKLETRMNTNINIIHLNFIIFFNSYSSY